MERHQLRHISLRSFRNYDAIDLELNDGFHVLSGQNGQGKTNFLEALYLLGSTRLLRGIRDVEAVKEGATKTSVTGEMESTTVSLLIEHGSRKKAFLNGVALPRASDLIGRLPCVCVSSEDLAIVQGEPSDRRLFLDLELSQAHAGYLRHFTLYKRALEQRNALLKQTLESYVAAESFEPWEVQLAHHGSAIRKARREFITELQTYSQHIHSHLGEGEPSSLFYDPKDDFESEEELQQAFVSNRPQEIYRKSTQIGPHRDEMKIEVEGREARVFGSQGQQRSAVLALKLGTMELLTKRLGITPLLLLDDILSDLDQGRRSRLAGWVLERAAQAVLTCTEAESAGPDVLANARVYVVKSGSISRI